MSSAADVVDRWCRDRVLAAAQALVNAYEAGENVPFDTGNLAQSMERGTPAQSGVGRVTVDFWVDPGRAPYGVHLQTGTGVFGPTGRRITPRVARALKFRVGGSTVFARSVAGSGRHRGWWTAWWSSTAPGVLRRRV